MPILERVALDPFALNTVRLAVAELTDLHFTFAVFAIEAERDLILEAIER